MPLGQEFLENLSRAHRVFVGIELLLREIVRTLAADAGVDVGMVLKPPRDHDALDAVFPGRFYDTVDRSTIGELVAALFDSKALKPALPRLTQTHSSGALRTKLQSIVNLRNAVDHCWPVRAEAAETARHDLFVLASLASNARMELSSLLRGVLDEIVPGWGGGAAPADRRSLAREIEDVRKQIARTKREGGDTAELTRRLRALQREEIAERVPEIGERFELLERVGQGAFADVWLVRDTETDEQVALRLLQRRHWHNSAVKAGFKGGVRCLKQLAQMPNPTRVVRFLQDFPEDCPESKGYPMYSAVHYPHGNLSNAVKRQALDVRAGLAVVRDVGEALAVLHEKGFVHRDVCPQNILLDRETTGEQRGTWRGVLGDFDAVMRLGEFSSPSDPMRHGHIDYTAPERRHRTSAPDGWDPLSAADQREAIAGDIYSLAATALFVVTGRRPDVRHDDDPVFDEVPVDLRHALRRGCAENWRERYESVRELVADMHLGQPGKVLERTMAGMWSLQGVQCDDRLTRCAQEQIEGAAIVFTHSDAPGIQELWECPMSVIEPPSSDTLPMETCVRRFLVIIANFRSRCAAACLQASRGGAPDMSTLSEALGELVNASHDEEVARLSSDELVFVEYLFGLGYLEVFSQFGALFIAWLDANRVGAPANQELCQECAVRHSPGSSYVDGLRGAFIVHDWSMEYLRTWYRAKNRGKVWEQILTRWKELLVDCPDLVNQIHRVVSMRRIPEDHPQVITIAQVMHWEGWGGQGKLFRAIKRYSRSALSRLLVDFESQAFDWHGLSTSELHVNFSHRKNFFAAAIELLTDYSAGVVAVLLSDPVLSGRSDSASRRVRIWGDAVGPKRVSERRIMENVHLCGAHMRVSSAVDFELTLCDASAPSLQILADHPLFTRGQVRESRTCLWRDLNVPFPGEPGWVETPGASGASAPAEAPAPSSFDCYSCAISLHQVADRLHGSRHVRIREILSFATRIVRPGGVIAIPDVGHGVELQVFVLPTNLVDREGGWGGDLFSLEEAGSRNRLHRFHDVASTLDGRFVCRMTQQEAAAASEEKVKIPLPLLQLHRGSPSPLSDEGLAIYEAIPYLVVELTLREVRDLDARWCQEVAEGRGSELVFDVLKAWKPEAVAAVDKAPEIVAQLGYELAFPPHGPPPRPGPYLVWAMAEGRSPAQRPRH